MTEQAASANAPAAEHQNGLTADELQAEQAGTLPEREAMSILDVGGLNVGLPTPGDIGGVLDTGGPLGGQGPIDVGGQNPLDIVDHLPIDNLPIDGANPATGGGSLIGIPEVPAVPLDSETIA